MAAAQTCRGARTASPTRQLAASQLLMDNPRRDMYATQPFNLSFSLYPHITATVAELLHTALVDVWCGADSAND